MSGFVASWIQTTRLDFGKWATFCHNITMLNLSALIQWRNLTNAQSSQQLHEGYDRGFSFVFLRLEVLQEMMMPKGVKGSVLFQCDQVILSVIMLLQVFFAKHYPYSDVGL